MLTLTPAMELVMAISALQSQMLKRIDQGLGVHGISFSELMVLYRLYNAPNSSLRRIDLAEAVGLSASGVTRMLAPMEKIKLVQKEANPRDARVSLVKLSKSGERVLKESMASFKEDAASLLQGLDSTQQNQFLELCGQLK